MRGSRKHPRLPNPALTAVLATVSLMAAPLAAHEFWIEPLDFSPEVGEAVGVRLFVGDGFERGRPYARNPRHLKAFYAAGVARTAVPGRPGAEPAGRLVPQLHGDLLIGYESHPSRIVLPAERFESYLRNEGLEHVIEARRELGEAGSDGREGFARAAKSLLSVGTARDDRRYDSRLGLAVEIVPLNDPRALAPGEPLDVLVEHHGAALPDAQIRAFLRGRPEATFDVRTDARGRASLELSGSGTWLLSVVHMERASEPADVDWLSTWSSLTFSLTRSTLAESEAAIPNHTIEEKAE